MVIEFFEGEGQKTVFVCPLCGSQSDNEDDANECIAECAQQRYYAEEKTITGDLWVCSECGKQFFSETEAKEHPFNCVLLEASKHPSQSKLSELF